MPTKPSKKTTVAKKATVSPAPKKKSIPAATQNLTLDLPLDLPAREKTFAVATAEQLFANFGLKDSDLRNIANGINPLTGQPWFPKPAMGKYQTVATINGYIDYLKHRATRPRELPEFPTMEAMANATGWTKSFLQVAKANNCPGFENSRCDSAKIIPWINGNEEKIGDSKDWVKHREKYDALNSQLKYEEASGDLMPRAVAVESSRAAQAILFASVDRMPIEFSTRLAGCDAAKIKTEVETFINESVRSPYERQLETLEHKTEEQIQSLRQGQGELKENENSN